MERSPQKFVVLTKVDLKTLIYSAILAKK